MTDKQLKALRVILAMPGEETSAKQFAIAMGYHKPKDRGKQMGRTGAAVLKRLQKAGYVVVWDDWGGNGSYYVTMARLTDAGRAAVTGAAQR